MNIDKIGAAMKTIDELRAELVKLRGGECLYLVGAILSNRFGDSFAVVETPTTLLIDIAGRPPVAAYALQKLGGSIRYVLPREDVECGGFLLADKTGKT